MRRHRTIGQRLARGRAIHNPRHSVIVHRLGELRRVGCVAHNRRGRRRPACECIAVLRRRRLRRCLAVVARRCAVCDSDIGLERRAVVVLPCDGVGFLDRLAEDRPDLDIVELAAWDFADPTLEHGAFARRGDELAVYIRRRASAAVLDHGDPDTALRQAVDYRGIARNRRIAVAIADELPVVVRVGLYNGFLEAVAYCKRSLVLVSDKSARIIVVRGDHAAGIAVLNKDIHLKRIAEQSADIAIGTRNIRETAATADREAAVKPRIAHNAADILIALDVQIDRAILNSNAVVHMSSNAASGVFGCIQGLNRAVLKREVSNDCAVVERLKQSSASFVGSPALDIDISDGMAVAVKNAAELAEGLALHVL